MPNKNYVILGVMELKIPGQPDGHSFETVAGNTYNLEETIGDALVKAKKATIAPAAETPPGEKA